MMNDFMLMLPMTIVSVGALVLMLVSRSKSLSVRNYHLIAVAFLVVAFFVELLHFGSLESSYMFEDIFGRVFIVDSFSNLFDLMFCAGAALTILISADYFKSRDYYNGEFFALLLFSVFGMMAIAHANELITAFISLEIASISIYVMVGYNKENEKSGEGMMKYLILGSLTGAFFILGTALIYGAIGSTLIGDIYTYIQTNPEEHINMLLVGSTFIMVTILFKIGAVPFHSWVIDVYQGAPFPVSMFMASTFKVALFALALRLYLNDYMLISGVWSEIFQIITVLTLLGGSWLTLTQNNLKRMLAGSSIVHSGYMMIGLTSVTLGGEIAASAVMFYLISYFISAVGSFGILSYIATDVQKQLTYEDFKGFGKERPYMAAMMTIFLLSLAGFPSTIGFLGKFYIFISAIQAGEVALAFLGIMMAFVSVYYYFKLINMMYFYPGVEKPRKMPFSLSSVFIAIMALMTIWGGIGTGLIPFMPGADGLIAIAQEAISSLHQ